MGCSTSKHSAAALARSAPRHNKTKKTGTSRFDSLDDSIHLMIRRSASFTKLSHEGFCYQPSPFLTVEDDLDRQEKELKVRDHRRRNTAKTKDPDQEDDASFSSFDEDTSTTVMWNRGDDTVTTNSARGDDVVETTVLDMDKLLHHTAHHNNTVDKRDLDEFGSSSSSTAAA